MLQLVIIIPKCLKTTNVSLQERKKNNILKIIEIQGER